MSTEMQTKVQTSPVRSFTPAQTGLLQRKSALCDTPGLVEDSKQDKEKLTLQRSSADQAGATTVPRFGHDFSRLSVHSTGLRNIQTKLKINEPGDIYEQEADRVAEHVMRMEEPRVQRQPAEELVQKKLVITPIVQRQSEEEEEFLQTKELPGQSPEVMPALSSRIQSLRGGGQPLLESARAYFKMRSSYDFSRVSVHSTGPGMIQTKLKINEPGDLYEQEADRVTEQVMRMPKSAVQLKPGCLFAKGPSCEEEKILQTKEVGSVTTEISPAVESQINSLRGGGQPLPESLSSFFEQRFASDFRQVRIHTGAQASELAAALKAQAFTIGRNIVFDDQHYTPETNLGKRLIAHELTHVIQQHSSLLLQRQAATTPKPTTPTCKEIKRDKFLRNLARWPGEAHYKWKKLRPEEQNIVLLYMAENYGRAFMGKFLKYTRTGPIILSHHYDSRIEWVTPEWLRARGYRWVHTDLLNQWWVHPSGKTISKGVGNEQQPSPLEEETLSLDMAEALDKARTYAEDKATLISRAQELKALAARTGSSSDEYIELYDQFVEAIRSFREKYNLFILDFDPYDDVVPGIPDEEPIDFS